MTRRCRNCFKPVCTGTRSLRGILARGYEPRLERLEGLRGLAALIVVAWHFIWAFAPWTLGSIAGWSPASGIVGSPLIASIDGPAAVVLFFVLSGFVVPLGFLRSGQLRTVLRSATKRWLRLAGLPVIAVLLSYLLFRLDLFWFRDAARLSHSEWLGSYGGSNPTGSFTPSLAGALQEGLISAFVAKSDVYDPVLWTMRHELLGSFVSLGTALVIGQAHLLAGCGALIAILVLTPMLDPWLLTFVAGTGLALVMSRRGLRVHWALALIFITAGVFFFGYLEPIGYYSALPVVQDSAGYRYDRIITHTLGALLILTGLIGNEYIGRVLSVRPLLVLGRLSFPIYLFHFPLLCSLGCFLLLMLQPALPYGASLGLVAIVYFPVVLVVGFLFAPIDERWAVWLNRWTDRVLSWSLGRTGLYGPRSGAGGPGPASTDGGEEAGCGDGRRFSLRGWVCRARGCSEEASPRRRSA